LDGDLERKLGLAGWDVRFPPVTLERFLPGGNNALELVVVGQIVTLRPGRWRSLERV
jgi:hypothetical protein